MRTAIERVLGRSVEALLQINGVDPAANVEISETVPANKAWQLIAVSVALVNGATAAVRPILVLDDGTDVIYESFGSSVDQAVSTTCRYTWAPNLELSGQVGAGANVHSAASLPEGLVLPAGYRVRTVSTLNAAANYGAPSLFVIQYG